jgi:hypothetical protein
MEIGLQANVFIGFNDLEYINDKFSIIYILYFDKYFKNKIIDIGKILLSDGYEFHLYHDFIEYC